MMSPTAGRIVWAGDVTFTVTGTPADIDALTRHIADYSAGPVGATNLPTYQLALCSDPTSFRAATQLFAGLADSQIEPVPGVILTQGTSPAGCRCYSLVRDNIEHAPGSWAAAVDRNRIELYVADPATIPRYALRLIREAMLRSYENAGGIVFHAAGASRDHRAVMICGPRNSGKTTTLAALLDVLGPTGALLANDRLIVESDGDTPRAVAVPLAVPVARGTLAAFPELHPFLTTPAAAGTPDGLPAIFGTPSKAILAPRAFAAAFDATLTAASRLHAVIVPQVTDTARPVRVRRLHKGAIHRAVRAACFTPVDEFWRPWLVPRIATAAVLTTAAAEVCAHIAATVPGFSIAYGTHRPVADLTDALTALIGALT
jgi:hypothetical protein